MAEEATSKTYQLYRLAYSLIFCRSLQEILDVATKDLAKSVQASNAILWLFSPENGTLEPGSVLLTDSGIKTRGVSLASDYLGEVYRSGKSLVLKSDLLRQPNKHIQFPKDIPLSSGICVPVKVKSELQGVLEMVTNGQGGPFTEEDVEFVSKGLDLVSVAAANMKSYEVQSRNQLNAITRLTLLYDIGQIFNSTLELDNLLPIITEKIRDILDAETCTIWFLNEAGDEIRCGKSTGGYQEIFEPYRAKLEEDVIGEVIQQGEGVLLEDASVEERLHRRFADPEETPVYTYMASPLECKGKIIGALEVMNRTIDETFNEEDQFLLNDLSHQAAVSIHNANLLRTERKAKELDSLLVISREITATLNLERVLKTIVNQSATLIPYDRASIALIDHEKVDVAAVSGRMEIDKKSPEIKTLQEIVSWASRLGKGLYISEFNEQILTDREETREKFKTYFEKTGMKSFISLPLKDEEGELGILTFESTVPYFLDERHLEVVSILANQATVAIRNAQLYKQVPLINLMEPLMEKHRMLLKMPKRRRIAWLAGIAAAILLLILVPWNMRVVGNVTVLSTKQIPVVSEVEGIVKNVYFREGTRVKKGELLATLEDRPYQLALEEQKTRRDLLLKQISQSQATGDASALSLHRIVMNQTEREIAYFQHELNRTRIVAPVDGIIVTPKIEERIGFLLKRGEQFCELADMSQPRAEVHVDEGDAGYVKAGQKVKLKMNAFPTTEFTGTVTLLGAQVHSSSDAAYYRIEAKLENPDLFLKPGMVGKAKVETGYRSVGYVILRKPFQFIRKKLWVWLP